MSIVVTGANGLLGRLVVADLLASGVPAANIKGVVRSLDKGVGLGIPLHVADYDRPETFADAFQPGDRVLLISGTDVGRRAAQHAVVIDAAKAAGVAQLAYTSVLGGPAADFVLAGDHKATEQLILDSGLPYTFLRNGWYSEMYFQDFAGIVERGEIVNGVNPDGRIATATREDFAAAAAAVLTGDGHLGKAYELSGDVAWSFKEFADEISGQTGKPVVHQYLTPAENKELLVSVGLPEGFADLLVDVDDAINRGKLGSTTGDLARLIGRPTTPIAESIARAVNA